MLNLYETVKSHPEYFKQLTCKNLLFTQYDCPQLEAKAGLFSQCNYIVYVLSGKRILHKPGISWLMTEGVSVFGKKGGWVAEKGPNDGWCVMLFFIPDNYLQQFIKEYRASLPMSRLPAPPPEQIIALDVNDTTHSFFKSMLPYFTQPLPPPESLLELKFRELVFNLLVNPANAGLLAYLNSIESQDRPPLEEIMEANYMYDLSLTDFAKLAHRSLAAFKREFKNVYHITPGKWLMQKRLDHSRLLLSTSSKPVNEVAYESGFKNTTHFNRVFKDNCTITPLQFRKQVTPA
jgi:AraC-like DNA-binding protein